jgi:membrane protease YdiL (CAAX protease family)
MLVPHSMLGSAGVVVSVFNGLFKEVVFRGVFFDALEAPCGAWVAVAITAAIFGYVDAIGHGKLEP